MNLEENLKLPTEGEVRLEELVSFAGTLSFLQNLDKKLSFTNQFMVEKSHEDEPEKTNTEAEVQSMVTVPIHQDTSFVPLITTPVIDITDPQSDSITVPASMPTTTTTVTETTTTTIPPPPPQPQQDVLTLILTQTIIQLEQNIGDLGDTVEFIDSQEIDQKIEESVKEVVTASVQHAMRAPLLARFKDLSTSDIKEIMLQRIEQFDADKAEERTKKKSKQDSPNTPPESPPPPPPPLPPSGASGKILLHHHRLQQPIEDIGSDDEDIDSRHIPKVSLNQEWFKPLSEEERPATPKPAWSIPLSSLPVPNNNWASAIASSFVSPPENSLLSQTGNIRVFIDWFCKKQGITELTSEHLEGPAYEVVKAFYPDGDRLALSITKMKATSYLDARLEQMVPDQMYDISASYGIFHWWFKRQQFYIERHLADTNRRAIVRTHMRILSVVRIEVFSLCGSPKPPTAQRQEDSLYYRQLMDKEFGYQKMGRRLPARHRELPDSAEPHQTSLGSYMSRSERISEQFDADKAEERTKKKSKQDSPKTPSGSPPPPPPPPPPSGASGASGPTRTSNSAQDPPPPPPSSTTNRAWTTTASRLKPTASSVPEDVLMHEESDFEAQDIGSDDEDSGKERPITPEPAWSITSSSLPVPNNNWASAIASIFVSLPENSLLSQTGNIGVFIDWFCKKQGITELTPEHLEGPVYEVV
ncbi:hypothetical protein Tco_0834581, partial [Tanacetum coccineum]